MDTTIPWNAARLDEWIGIIHFLSDWHRSPALRRRFIDIEHHEERVRILRDDYLFTEEMIGAFTRHERKELAWIGLPVLLDWNADLPSEWKGAPPQADGQPDDGVGWPGGPMQCIEAVTIEAPVHGVPAAVRVTGWNARTDWIVRFREGEHGPAVDLPLEGMVAEPTGRWTLTTEVTFPAAGEYDVGLLNGEDEMVVSSTLATRIVVA